ncbi:MAG: imelysin family protein, partial [Myxococcota bacterium]
AVDSDLDERIQSEMEATITAINAIPVPFDKALTTTDGQAKIQAAIDALRTQTDSISEAADALGLTLTLE